MTVYELIRGLTQYPADATMNFKIGALETDTVVFDFRDYSVGKPDVYMELI